MEVITIQSEAYNSIIGKIDSIITLFNAKEKESKDKWLDNSEMIDMLKISKRTAQTYRDTGIISFSQVGAKIYYRLSDIDALLEKNYNKAFKK